MRVLLLCLLIGCAVLARAQSRPHWVWMHYEETFCSDPWYSLSDTLTHPGRLRLIGQHLGQQGIAHRRGRVVAPEPGITRCAGCGCTTGFVIHLEIAASDSAKAATLGFKHK